jgi:hypothetical protein
MSENLQQLLDQKDRDLELAAQYGTALLEENKKLKEKLQELKERVAGMEMEGSYEMKEQIQLLEESNKVLKSKVTILESKNGDLEAKIILKNAQKEDLAQTIDELTRKLKNADERIGMLQKELENNSTAGTIYELNEKLEMQKEVIQDLRIKHAETQRINTELTKKLDDATKKMDKLSASQVSNEIDPALLEELKELRQSNSQFKREIKEKDEIISELQTRPAEARPTIYQRTIVEVPAYAPVPGNSDNTSENYPTSFDHIINADSDITVQPKINNTVDTQTNSSDTLTPMTPMTPMTSTTATSAAPSFTSESNTNYNKSSELDTTYVAKSDSENRSEATQVNGYVKSEPVAIQKPAESHQGDAKATEKTPPSSPKALYRDPRVQELAAKLAESERQLNIKSDEVQRLSLKLAEMAERASYAAPQTTIINQIVQPKKEGFLIKQGARVKNWKRRFFFIESDFLYYSESPKTRFVTLGMINLDGAEVDQAIVPNRAHVIAVKTSSRTFYLCAESEQDMHEWLNLLKEKVEDIAEKKKNEK